MKYVITTILCIALLSMGIFIGFLLDSPETIYQKENSDGCWNQIKSGEDRGDWICVNVEDMSYERALEVCKHEVGHEIFAEICEKDIDKCFEIGENE